MPMKQPPEDPALFCEEGDGMKKWKSLAIQVAITAGGFAALAAVLSGPAKWAIGGGFS